MGGSFKGQGVKNRCVDVDQFQLFQSPILSIQLFFFLKREREKKKAVSYAQPIHQARS